MRSRLVDRQEEPPLSGSDRRTTIVDIKDKHPLDYITLVNVRDRRPVDDFVKAHSSYFDGAVQWGVWWARKWLGTPDGVPPEVGAFRQAVAQALTLPEYERCYPSYVRAVPLFTEEEIEAEKDTPTIIGGVSYHIAYATRYPYALIPVPEKESPFPAGQAYTPGDRFKVRHADYGEGLPPYFLIETFRGNR
jgi:hypothetical protein